MALLLIFIMAGFIGGSTSGAQAQAASPATRNGRELPARTSPYNKGGYPGRYRQAPGGPVKLFRLKHEVPVLDGAGNEIGRARKSAMLNTGAVKEMDLDGRPGREVYVWGWRTEGGSGWLLRDALEDPPPVVKDPDRNPPPPRESTELLSIDAAAGREKLKRLRHVNTQGIIPAGAGNMGDHYAGRKPGPKDFVYLLFAVPNVQRGGMAKDSIPNGGRFVQGLDEEGRPIEELMTMYQDGDLNKPVLVTFIYGRVPGSDLYGWLARANVGAR